MIKSGMKYLGMVCTCLLLMLLPINVKANESITGGATFEEATLVECGKEYISTNADGWFKILVPENTHYVGGGYDKFSSIEGYVDKQTPLVSTAKYSRVGSIETELGDRTEYWYSSGKEGFEEYYYFHVKTDIAESCSFQIICDVYYDKENRQAIKLGEDYVATSYVAGADSSSDYGNSYYSFVAANTGTYKIFMQSTNAYADINIRYKDGSSLEFLRCDRNSSGEKTFDVTAGLTYYVSTHSFGTLDRTKPAIINFQISNAKVADIVLNSDDFTMNKGEQIQLVTEIIPKNAVDKTLTYISSNPQVAMVSEEGVVTAIRGGNAQITVEANDGSGVQAICSITVLPQLVTRLELNSSYIEKDLTTLYNTQLYQQLEATVYPIDADDTTVIYTSSNTNVVSVDQSNGMMTFKNPGTATITCTTNDGSNLTKTCQVVLKKSPKVITLNANSKSMNKGEQFQLTADITPQNAVDKTVSYTSSNLSVATISKTGLITAVGNGSAVITVKFNDESGVQAKCSVTVTSKLVTRLELNGYYIEEDLATFDDEEYFYQLIATAYPTDANDTSVTYTSSDTNIVSVDKQTGILTLKKPGTAIITCKTNDGSNLTKTCKVVLKESRLNGYKKTIDKINYKVTSDSFKGGTVVVYGVSNKNMKSYTIDNSVTIDGYSYKVAGIQDRAFKNCKKATSIVLGSQIQSIGKEAFCNCNKLKALTINSKKLKTVGKDAFKNIHAKATIKVPSSKLSKYKKLMKDKGQKKSVKIKKMNK